MDRKETELLLPAGSQEKMSYAYAYGADAVYAGIPAFSLRARENSFNLEQIANSINYAHQLGKRFYLTMNIYVHNNKVQSFLKCFQELEELKPDGFIMTDAGLIARALEIRPKSVIHLSTQANSTNHETVRFWQKLGVRRIILPRELSIKEIAEIHQQVPDIELEAFVHGAICIAYSGRCLISNYLNYRDANQGTCSNSCRWHYELSRDKESLLAVEEQMHSNNTGTEGLNGLISGFQLREPTRPQEYFPIDEDLHGTYLMNSKDLCAIELLKPLKEAGVSSFKVEGRTKSEYYISVIARAYRRAIDDLEHGRDFNKDNFIEALHTSTRTFTSGFYLRPPKEYAINYDDAESLPLLSRYCAKVLDIKHKSGKVLLEVKNKLISTDQVEWISPKENCTNYIGELFSSSGKAVEQVSGGCKCLVNAADFEISEFSLLRKKL